MLCLNIWREIVTRKSIYPCAFHARNDRNVDSVHVHAIVGFVIGVIQTKYESTFSNINC